MEILLAALAATAMGVAGFYAGALAAWVPPVLKRAAMAPWGEDATRRLLKAVEETAVCESCKLREPVLVATWPDEASASFLVCRDCASLIPAGAAKLEEL